MNEQTATLELQQLQSDINNLLVPDEFSKPSLTVGSIKTQIISKLCAQTKKEINDTKQSLSQALKNGREKVKERLEHYDDSIISGTVVWMIFTIILFPVSLIAVHFISYSHYVWETIFSGLATTAFLLNPYIFYARRAFFANHREYKKLSSQLNNQLDQQLVKLDSDSGYLVAQIREHLGQTATEFRSRFIKAEANFKEAASEPRIKAQEAISRLERQKEKVTALDDKVSCPENKTRITTKIDEAIKGYKQFIEELAPKEERLLKTAIIVKDQLQQLQTKVNGLESIQTQYESYQSIMDELSEHNIKLENLRSEHSSNMDFVQGQLNELCQDVLGIHKTINDCRYLLPGLDLVETATLPAPEVRQIAVSVA